MQHDHILKKFNFQQKILTIAFKFEYLTFNPLGGVKGGGVKILTLPCLSTGTGQSWSIVRKKLLKCLMKCEDDHT